MECLYSVMLIQRPESHTHLQDGHLALSGLQVRGHAMFSHKDLPLDSETLEYAWLLEVTIGDITGRLTAPQVYLLYDTYFSQIWSCVLCSVMLRVRCVWVTLFSGDLFCSFKA